MSHMYGGRYENGAMVDPRARWESREFRVGPGTIFVNSITGEQTTLHEQQEAMREARERQLSQEAGAVLLEREVEGAWAVIVEEAGDMLQLTDVHS